MLSSNPVNALRRTNRFTSAISLARTRSKMPRRFSCAATPLPIHGVANSVSESNSAGVESGGAGSGPPRARTSGWASR
jgi:hypothetical protein